MTAAAMAPAAFRRVRDLVLPPGKQQPTTSGSGRDVLARHPGVRVNRHHERFLDTCWQHSWRRPVMVAALLAFRAERMAQGIMIVSSTTHCVSLAAAWRIEPVHRLA